MLITAQHTHSATGGYSEYPLYNITIPGFIPEVYQAIVDGIIISILEADKTKEPGHLKYKTGEFDPDIEVAFNRSIKAYNQNPETQKKNN